MEKVIPLIIFGALGHQQEIYYLIKSINKVCLNEKYDVLGFIERESSQIGSEVCDGKKVIASDETLKELILQYRELGAVISQGDTALKQRIYSGLEGYSNIIYPNLIHSNVIYEKEIVKLGKGNIIAAGTVIAANLEAGDFNLINRSCTIGHDVSLGKFNTINPGSTISGNVSIGSGCFIGAGATILQGISLADRVTIGAGAVVTKNGIQGGTYIGVPARPQ